MAFKDFISKNLPTKRDEISQPFLKLQHEMNQMFDNFFDNFRLSPFRKENLETFPRVDIKETNKEVDVSAELPGLEAKDIDISISDNILTLSGEKSKEAENKGEGYYRMERIYGSFHRSVMLPTEVESDNVKAVFKNGILRITIPKKPEANEKQRK